MATVSDRMHESTVGAVRGGWAALGALLERGWLWLGVAAYGVVNAVLLVGAALAAVYLAGLIPGMAGIVVFLTVGLALIAAAPTAARRLFLRTLDAIEASREADSGEMTHTSGSGIAETTDRGKPELPTNQLETAIRWRTPSRWTLRDEDGALSPSLYWSSPNREGLRRPKRRETDGG